MSIKRMNRSDLAFASFVTNYEFNPTRRPVIFVVELSRIAEDQESQTKSDVAHGYVSW